MEEAELTPALERVAASVVETHRKRQQVDDELKAAAAVIASLHAQSSSLEASVTDLRSELESALKAKSQEDAAVVQLAARRQAALDQMTSIDRDIATFLADKDRSAAEITSQIEGSRTKLASVRQELTSVKDGLASLERDTTGVRDRLNQVRKSTDDANAQLNETQSKAKELDGAVDVMAARVCAVTEELDHVEKSKQRVVSSGDELRAVSAALEVHRREALAAAEQMRKLLADREHQTSSLAQQLERIAQLSGDTDAGKSAAPPATNASTTIPMAAPTAAPATVVAPAPTAAPATVVAPAPAAAPAAVVAPAPTAAPAATVAPAPAAAPAAVVAPAPAHASPPDAVRSEPVAVTGNPAASAAVAPDSVRANGSPTNGAAGAQRFENTLVLLELLASVGFIAAPEAQSAAELLRLGDVDKLVRSMWSRAMGGPAPGFYRLVIGSALSESNDPKGAMTFFNKALEGRQVDPFATYLVAVALLRMKRYVDVLNIAQALGRSKTGKALARNVEALHLQGTGRLDDAEKKFGEALGLAGHPRLHYNETMYNLGRLAESRGDARTAYMWYEKLASGDPSYRDIGLHMDTLRASAQTG
jgi:uncharacterized phage infection (PIP) family protein YhgE